MAGKKHGNKGRLYIAFSSGGSAEPMPNTGDWNFNSSTSSVDVTSQGDTNINYVTGLPDAQGTFSGFFDHSTKSTYRASVDGLPRKMYAYPDATDATQYWYGQVYLDFAFVGAVNDANKTSGTWKAAGPISDVGM